MPLTEKPTHARRIEGPPPIVLVAAWALATALLAAGGCTLSRSGLLPQSCSTDDQCTDYLDPEAGVENPCTVDHCIETGICENLPTDGTGALVQVPFDCQRKECQEGKVVSLPDDQDRTESDCVVASCTNGELSETFAAQGAPCTEGMGSGECDGEGTCKVVCTMVDDPACDDGKPCTVDLCNLSTGVCDRELLDSVEPPSMPNVDGDCVAFLCVAGEVQILDALTDIPEDGKDCTEDLCVPGNPNATPQNNNLPVDTPCGTGKNLVCDGMGTCQNCNSNDDCGNDTTCLVYTCVNASCVETSQTGMPCNDGELCNGDDTCGNTGQCSVHPNPVVCLPLDQCHSAGTCSNGTCSNPNKGNGVTCNDGDACTQTDTCQNGTCTGANPVVCTPLDQCHDAGTCSNGTCSNPNKGNGATCNDGDACTQMDTCQNGTCTAGSPVVCTPLDQCHDAGTCSNGTCSNPSKMNGATCDDGMFCTATDTCQSGVCTGSGDPCTLDCDSDCMDGCNEGANNCTGMSPELSTCIGGSTNCNDQCMSGVCVNNNQG